MVSPFVVLSTDLFFGQFLSPEEFYYDNKNMANNDNKKVMLDLFRAYYNARENKGHSFSVLAFERNYEERLFELYNDIIKKRYVISPSVCFISFKPLKREIFAANFRDR